MLSKLVTKNDYEVWLSNHFDRFRVIEKVGKLIIQLPHPHPPQFAELQWFYQKHTLGIVYEFERLSWWRCWFKKKQWVSYENN